MQVISLLTKTNTAVLQQITQVIKHGFLILSTYTTEVTQKTATVRHHLWKGDFLCEKLWLDTASKQCL